MCVEFNGNYCAPTHSAIPNIFVKFGVDTEKTEITLWFPRFAIFRGKI